MKNILISIVSGIIGSVIMFSTMADAQRNQVQYPLDAQSAKTVSTSVQPSLLNQVFDLQWKRLFHYITFFEGLGTASSGGFTTAVDGTGSITADGTGFVASTDSTSGHGITIARIPSHIAVSTFNQKSNFRTVFNLGSNTSQTVYIIVGNLSSDYYGFKVVNGKLYGVSHDATTENLIDLKQNLSASTDYNIEARYEPNSSVQFFFASPTSTPSLVGISTSNLPRSTVSGKALANQNLFELRIVTNTTAVRTLSMSFFEYLQARNILK